MRWEPDALEPQERESMPQGWLVVLTSDIYWCNYLVLVGPPNTGLLRRSAVHTSPTHPQSSHAAASITDEAECEHPSLRPRLAGQRHSCRCRRRRCWKIWGCKQNRTFTPFLPVNESRSCHKYRKTTTMTWTKKKNQKPPLYRNFY